MIPEEQLTALDLTLWLGSTERAANFSFSDQSTVSRRNRKVIQLFEIELKRSDHQYYLSGELQLLDLERQVHQLARLKRQKGLRLQAPFWLQCSHQIVLPKGWGMNSPRKDISCQDPVTLVRDHVLDACLATPTQIPDNRDDLFIVELHNRPLNLTLLTKNKGSQDNLQVRFQWTIESGNLKLQLMPFLPASCCERSQQWFDKFLRTSHPDRQNGTTLRPSSHSGESFLVAFLTPEMRMAQPQDCQVYEHFEPYTYTESLIVLAQNANESAILALIETLQQQIGN